jgi:hypothetical protein
MLMFVLPLTLHRKYGGRRNTIGKLIKGKAVPYSNRHSILWTIGYLDSIFSSHRPSWHMTIQLYTNLIIRYDPSDLLYDSSRA